MIDSPFAPDFTTYAYREYAILRARIRGHLTTTEYKHARWWAYYLHGYNSPHSYGNWNNA
jgi:hypothetical protein